METVVWQESPESTSWWNAVTSRSLEVPEADRLEQVLTVPEDPSEYDGYRTRDRVA